MFLLFHYNYFTAFSYYPSLFLYLIRLTSWHSGAILSATIQPLYVHGRYYPVAPALAPSFFTWFWLLDDCCHGHFTKRQKDTSTLISNFFLTLHGHDNVWVHLSVHPFVVETLCYMYNTRRFGLLVYWSIHPLTCESIDTKHLSECSLLVPL